MAWMGMVLLMGGPVQRVLLAKYLLPMSHMSGDVAEQVPFMAWMGALLPQGSRDWQAVYGVSSLNIENGSVSRFQSAYLSENGQLWPSFSAQIARLAGVSRPLNTDRRILRYLAPDQRELPVVSFRDVVSGNLRFSELQNKVVLIGVTASGVAGNTFPDSRFNPVPGVILQARAVSSLLSEPFKLVNPLLTALICAALAGLAGTAARPARTPALTARLLCRPDLLRQPAEG